MTFDRKISIGTVIQALTFIGAAFGVWVMLERRLTASEKTIAFVQEKQKDHTEEETKRLDRIEGKIDRLLEKRER